jgi:hypothetical protein
VTGLVPAVRVEAVSATPGPEELRLFARQHLLYEVTMLFQLAQRVVLPPGEHYPAAVRNAELEAFAIHARLLLGFLHEKPEPKSGDALARHYADTWTPPALTATLSKVPERVGREVAHLSYGRPRLDEEARGWPVEAIAADIGATLKDFVAQADPARLPADVATKVRELTTPPVDPLAALSIPQHRATAL